MAELHSYGRTRCPAHWYDSWSIFPADTNYFGPGTSAGQQAMINYRVDNLDE